jgi:hypothetical protein
MYMTDLFPDVIPQVSPFLDNFVNITVGRLIFQLISPRILQFQLISPRILQTTESSPPRQSNSGKDIDYAPGLIPNGGGLSPPVIGYHAPKTSSLLQGQLREPADAGKKRKTKASAVDSSAIASKKKAKKKSKPTDDLPALDPSIEEALDEEEIEDDVNQAAAELSSPEKTPSASPKQTPSTPAALAHFSRVSNLSCSFLEINKFK